MQALKKYYTKLHTNIKKIIIFIFRNVIQIE